MKDKPQHIDLSSMTITWFRVDDHRFRMVQPLVLYPYWDDLSQSYGVKCSAISLWAFAKTRHQLWLEIADQIAVIWKEYVECDQGELAPDAIQLRSRLLKMVECNC